MGGTSLNEYLKKIKNDGGTPFIQAPKIAQQSSNFTSGNPGSSANASNKGKSTNFSKASNPANWSLSSIKGSESHYDGAMPYQQAPMPDTFMPSQTETHSWDWRGENLQSSDGSLQSMVNPENPRSSLGAMPYQEAPIPDTFMPSQTETHSWDWSGGNLQSNDGSLQSMVNPENPRSSSHYGGAMPYQEAPMPDTFMPSQTETHSWDWRGENLQSSDGSLQSMVNPENPRSSHYGGAMPYQEAPIPDTFMPSQTETHSWDWSGGNLQSNDGSLQSMVNPENPRSSHYGGAMPSQQAPLMPDTFMPSQTETHSWDWSGGNLQNDAETLESMFSTRKPSSSKASFCKANISRQNAKGEMAQKRCVGQWPVRTTVNRDNCAQKPGQR
ncbi:hypothetical protein GPALN_005884 [Globodera pallida]|nr:hypothetical protein GPALN_005884 [Globodera pallida]